MLGNKWLVLTWQIQDTSGQNSYLSWALKKDLDFNGKCRVRIGEEPREIDLLQMKKKQWCKDKKR